MKKYGGSSDNSFSFSSLGLSACCLHRATLLLVAKGIYENFFFIYTYFEQTYNTSTKYNKSKPFFGTFHNFDIN